MAGCILSGVCGNIGGRDTAGELQSYVKKREKIILASKVSWDILCSYTKGQHYYSCISLCWVDSLHWRLLHVRIPRVHELSSIFQTKHSLVSIWILLFIKEGNTGVHVQCTAFPTGLLSTEILVYTRKLMHFFTILWNFFLRVYDRIRNFIPIVLCRKVSMDIVQGHFSV